MDTVFVTGSACVVLKDQEEDESSSNNMLGEKIVPHLEPKCEIRGDNAMPQCFVSMVRNGAVVWEHLFGENTVCTGTFILFILGGIDNIY